MGVGRLDIRGAYLDQFLLQALAAHCCQSRGVVREACGGVEVAVSPVLIDRSKGWS